MVQEKTDASRVGFFSSCRHISPCATIFCVAKDVLRGTNTTVARWKKPFRNPE
jgi:hypothetical protein